MRAPFLCVCLAPLLGAGCSDGNFLLEPTSGSATALTAPTPQALSCASGSTLTGVDVSTYQGTIDWKSVKAAGISFAFAKATESTNIIDSTFATNWAGMKAAGVVRGAYHFFDPSVDAASQASYCLATVGALEAGDLPVVLDFEQLGGKAEAAAVADAVTFLAAVTAATGKRAILYMSSDFLSASYPALSPYVLWVANYGVTCPGLPVEWSGWDFWQHSDTGAINGISGAVDLDTFNGTSAQLGALTGAGAGGSDAGLDAAAEGGGGGHTDAGDAGEGEGDAGPTPPVDAGPEPVPTSVDAAAPSSPEASAPLAAGSAACALSPAPPARSPSLLAVALGLVAAWFARRRRRVSVCAAGAARTGPSAR